MWHQINRLIVKYSQGSYANDPVAVELVEILTGHLDDLGVENPTDPLSYEELMGYHLKYPPFFPNQKVFKSDDDFFVKQQEMFADPDAASAESIIDRRRAWFLAEMEKKRERNVSIKYYDANGWSLLPAAGLSSLSPYKTSSTTEIKFGKYKTGEEFADSGKGSNVAALYESYLYVDPMVTEICVASDDGSKLYLDGVLKINLDGTHGTITECASVTDGVYKMDLEYFQSGGGAELKLMWGTPGNRRIIPPRAWADVRIFFEKKQHCLILMSLS